MTEELLPKPQTDLPLPEKELSAHATEPVVKNEAPYSHYYSKSRLMIIGVIVLLIIVGITGAAYVMGKNANNQQAATTNISPAPTPTPDPTADWQTYAGEGFSLKYPPDWTEVKIDNLVRFFSPGSEPENQSIATGKSEYIEIFTSKLDPKTCRGDCPPSGTLVNTNDLDKINPADYKTSEGLIGSMCACEVDKIYLKNGNLYYTLGLYGITDTQKTPPAISTKNELIFQQILSTFKFTKIDKKEPGVGIISNSENPGWKKYTNPVYNFSFEYPDDGNFEQDGSLASYEKLGPSQQKDTGIYDAINLSVYAGDLNGKTIEDLVNAEVSRVEKSDISTITQNPKKIIISGIEGTEFEITGLGKFKYIYLQPREELYITIAYSNPDPTNQGFQNTIDQILSTFKFTD